MDSPILTPTRCALCDTEGNAVLLYHANFDVNAFNPEVFSARRKPDRLHYRLVRCKACGLVRSDPVAEVSVLRDLYRQSALTYGDETQNIRETYGRYLRKLGRYGVNKGELLEIGCGSGFFLEEALAQGYGGVCGVEPSVSAVEKALPSLKGRIVNDVMREGLFESERFDAVCLFQTLDHLPDPGAVLAECRRVLKPGGFALALNHNICSWSARLLKSRSPIVDIEHTYLYSPRTIKALFAKHGYDAIEVGSVVNRYSVKYLARLIPWPTRLARFAAGCFIEGVLERFAIPVPLGNLYLVAQKRV